MPTPVLAAVPLRKPRRQRLPRSHRETAWLRFHQRSSTTSSGRCTTCNTKLDPKAVLPWWATTGKRRFPALAPVAQQVFGNQASAAQVERDFSGCGILLPPTRSRMDTYWVEMVMFVQANFEHIPGYGLIPMIAPKDIRSCLPARFTGANEDLVAAEAIFDLLSNTAAPTVHGMDLDEE